MNEIALILLRQQAAFVESDASWAAKAGAERLVDDPRLFLVPVAFAFPARAIAIVAAGHNVADARLLIAIVIVIRKPDFAEAIDAAFVVVAEVVGDEFDIFAVQIAAPDGGFLNGRGVAGILRAFAIAALQAIHATIADREIKFAIGADVQAVNAVVVVEAAEAGEELLRRAIRLRLGLVLAGEFENVRRLGDQHTQGFVLGVWDYHHAERVVEFLALVKRDRLRGFAFAFFIDQNLNAIAFRTYERFVPQLATVVHGFSNPHATLMIDINTGGVEEHRFGCEEFDLQPIARLHGGERFIGHHLCRDRRSNEQQCEERETLRHRERLHEEGR